jgi:hypothetical protein
VSITVTSRKLLWGRAGDRCAWPDCDQLLSIDLHDPETAVLIKHGALIGEEAHIRSGQVGGPRYQADYDKVDEYENLILLCPTHHTIVDKDNGAGWSVESLEHMKSDHELIVRSRMQPEEAIARDISERVAAAVDYWADDLLINWESIAYQMLLAYPRIREEHLQLLIERAGWLLAKDWPSTYPKLSSAFTRWLGSASLLIQHVNDTFDSIDGRDNVLELSRGHKRIGRWDPEAYKTLFDTFLINCVTLWYLVGELTRATNLVIYAVRLELDPLYQFNEGMVLVRAEDLVRGDTLMRLEFDDVDWNLISLEPSLEDIKKAIEAEKKTKSLPRYDDVRAFSLIVPIGRSDAD